MGRSGSDRCSRVGWGGVGGSPRFDEEAGWAGSPAVGSSGRQPSPILPGPIPSRPVTPSGSPTGLSVSRWRACPT